MSKFNLLVHLNAFEDQNSSNNPSRNYFKWAREVLGFQCEKPKAEEIIIGPNETRTLFDGSRSLSHDNTTQYSLSLKPATTGTYILKAVAGTLPNFRTNRNTSADNTTQVTVTKNANIVTFTSTAGTLFALNAGLVAVGDDVVTDGSFNALNKIKAKVVSFTNTSFSIENANGLAEGPVTLAAASDILIFSAAGVQKGDSLRIFGGFSPYSQNTYEVTSVGSDFVEFFSSVALPQESNIQTSSIAIYFGSKSFFFIEADDKILLNINGSSAGDITPFITGSAKSPAVFMKKSTMWSISISNDTIDSVRIFYVAVE
jgi:hypothetical protein